MRMRMLWMASAALMVAPLTAVGQQANQDGPGVNAGEAQINLPGPIDSPEDLLETARMLFVMADVNGDGQISQQEATEAGNLLVGGLFFRADANGDGTVSREEATQARQALLQQKPVLRFVIDRASRDNTPDGAQAGQQQAGTDPNQIAQAAWSLLDSNNDGQLQATEVRQAVQTGVQGLYAAADTNRDGQLSPAELNAAMYGAARAGLQATFQAADQDNSGTLSKEEFAQAVVQPAYTVFDILDRDLDGQLSPQELEQAARIAAQQIDKMTVDVPANSPANVLGSGRLPQGTDATRPAARQPAQPVQPAQPQPSPAQPVPAQPAQPR